MIEVLTSNTPNGKKITIMLEEIGYEYKITKINTKDESGLLKKHKSLEHEYVYKQLVNYLLS